VDGAGRLERLARPGTRTIAEVNQWTTEIGS
jgi:hypothetical protein